jgi:hypothetical protein
MLSTPVFPNLAGVITLSDVKQKGSGSYAADYVPWAKVMMLINQHCNGWLPELIEDANTGEYVHKAPNGTGYLCIQFVNGSYSTPVWTYAVMDNRNNAIAYEKISARDLADSHRRGICSAAAAFFSLGYELWARDEITANTPEKVETQPEIQLQQAEAKAPTKAAKKKERSPEPPTSSSATETVVSDELIAKCMELIQERLDRTAQVAWIADKATKWNLDGDGSKLKQMSVDQLQACIDELSAKPALKQ